MVHGHLQNLCFLQLGWALQTPKSLLDTIDPERERAHGDNVSSYFWMWLVSDVTPVAHLLLKGAGNQSAQLAQAVIDPVTASFLNDLNTDTETLFSELA